MPLTEHFGTCRTCWTDGVFPVTETDHGDAQLQCDQGHTWWITPHDPRQEPR